MKLVNIFCCLLITFISDSYGMRQSSFRQRQTPPPMRTIQPRDPTQDSDSNRQHDVAKPRMWQWVNSFNFSIQDFLPLDEKTGNPYNYDACHLRLCEIEQRFCSEMDQYRVGLKQNVMERKKQNADIQIQISEFSKRLRRIEQEDRLQENITAVFSEHDKGSEHFERWKSIEENGLLIQQISEGVSRYSELQITSGESLVTNLGKCKDFFQRRSRERTQQKTALTTSISDLNRQLKTDLSMEEKQLRSLSSTVNMATCGVSIIYRRDGSLNHYTAFQPLQGIGGKPIVFASNNLSRMRCSFFIEPIPRPKERGQERISFAYPLAQALIQEGSPYFDTLESYKNLSDTEAQAIYYLYNNGYSKLFEIIEAITTKNKISPGNIAGISIHIHTLKDPCGLCTRLMEGFQYQICHLLPGIGANPTIISPILVSSWDEYRVGSGANKTIRQFGDKFSIEEIPDLYPLQNYPTLKNAYEAQAKSVFFKALFGQCQ